MTAKDYIGKIVYNSHYGKGVVTGSSTEPWVAGRTYYIKFPRQEISCKFSAVVEMYNDYERLDSFCRLVLGAE